MDKLQDVHYFPLSSQGNIYTLTTLHLANDINKLLVASLRREVICFEYQENTSGVLVPTTKEISFTYLPNGAEIIAMDAFNKSDSTNDFVIGITIIKNSNDLNALETYLNIYSGWEESLEFNMESISQNCVNNIELKYIPYHLTHTYLITWNEDKLVNKEVVFLLSGSDSKIHVYQENKFNHTYKEADCKENFPEFLKPPSIVMWTDTLHYNDFKERVTAFGCECGYVRLCRVCVKTAEIVFNFSTRFNNTISSVRLYVNKYEVERLDVIKHEHLPSIEDKAEPTLNLVIINSILPAMFFGDILHYGLKKYGPLPKLNDINVLSCVEIADIDLDGCLEILVGTNNKDIMMYKFNPIQGWCVAEIKKLPSPIYGLKYIDITGDGVKELIVLTMKGVIIFQHDPKFVERVLEEKLKSLTIPNITTISLDD